jgi:hypothetical protein
MHRMTEPGPVPAPIPAAQPVPAWPPTPPPSRVRPATVGALLAVAAAVLVIVGSFLPLFIAEVRAAAGVGLTITITSWDFQAKAASGLGPASRYGATAINGIPLVFGAVTLLIGGVLAFLAAARRSTPATSLAAALITALGAAFLAGTAWTIGMQVISWFDSFRPTGSATGVDLDAGIGLWILLLAAAAAITAASQTWPRNLRTPPHAPQPPIAPAHPTPADTSPPST